MGHAHVPRVGTPPSTLASATSPPAPVSSWTHGPQPAGGAIPEGGAIVSRRMRPRESARARLCQIRARLTVLRFFPDQPSSHRSRLRSMSSARRERTRFDRAETKRGTYLASVSRDVRRCFAHKDPRATGCTPSQRRRRASRAREGASTVAGSHARQVQTPALARPVRPLERGASVIPVSDRETDSDARRATAARRVAGAIPDTRRGCRRARRPR